MELWSFMKTSFSSQVVVTLYVVCHQWVWPVFVFRVTVCTLTQKCMKKSGKTTTAAMNWFFQLYISWWDLVLCANRSLTVTFYRWDHPKALHGFKFFLPHGNFNASNQTLVGRLFVLLHLSICFIICPNSGYEHCYHRIRKCKGRMVRQLQAHLCWLWLLCTTVWSIWASRKQVR